MAQAIGPSRGGQTPKIHALTDVLGIPSMRLPVTHIVGLTFASPESAMILSVTPNHGGVADERWCGGRRSWLAGR
jgi:hypothetical protein